MNRKIEILTLLLMLTGVTLSAQFIDVEESTTRAVIVGISDYQDSGIPDLRFADRDAEAFAAFLQSPAGGNLNTENIRLLTNSKATNARFFTELLWLIEETQEGDLAIIYFSGHGDVEAKLHSQPGFLLPWDSPGQVYMAGALSIHYLQDIVTTLSLDNKARVLLIADACRSGKLAGSSIGGTELTSINLAKRFANEVKILSCQPHELSLEGEQWGGGRGVFSYLLVEGLQGLADANNDHQVNLLEIRRFLEDQVTAAVAPNLQVPMIEGKMTEILSTYDPKVLAQNPEKTEMEQPASRPNDWASRSPGDGNEQYKAFQQALRERAFFEPPGANAEELYRQLTADPALSFLYRELRHDFATALQDEAQQALNALLESDPAEMNNYYYNPEKYAQYPLYLNRSIELMGDEQVLVRTLKAKKKFFEAFNLTRIAAASETEKRRYDSLYHDARELLLEAISLEPDAAYLYNTLGLLYHMADPPYTDSVLKYCQKAIDISPTWLMPYLNIAWEYHWAQGDIDKEAAWLTKAVNVTADSFVVLERLCWLRQFQNRPEEAMKLADRQITARPGLFNGYANKGGVYYLLKNYPEAEKWMLRSQEFYNSPYQFSNDYLGYVYLATRRREQGIRHYEDLIADSRSDKYTKAKFYNWLGDALVNFTTDWEKAEAYYRKSETLEPNVSKTVRNSIRTGKTRVMQGRWDEAISMIEKVLHYDPKPNPALILAYSLLGDIEAHFGNAQKAEGYYRQGITYSTSDYPFDLAFREEALYRYGVFLLHKNRLDDAKSKFRECISYSHEGGYFGYYGIALLNAKLQQNDLALDYLEKALDHFYPRYEPILEEPLFKSIRQTGRFQELMARNFAIQSKD